MGDKEELERLRRLIEETRVRGVYAGELNWVANETLKNVLDFYTKTKPSELFTAPGKGGAAFEIPDPQLRELWQKWVEQAKRDLYEKAFELPGLTLDEVLKMFPGHNHGGEGTSAPTR
jgi:hypothetical protein